MLYPILQVVAGLVLLFAGSESLVRGSVALAIRFNISRIVIGLTIIAFATSSPELVVGIQAAVQGESGLVLGNMLGSNICNVALILGVAALIHPPTIHLDILRKEAPLVLAASMLTVLMLTNGLSRLDGGVLITLFLVYNVLLIRNARKARIAATAVAGDISQTPRNPVVAVLMVTGGLAMLVIGSDLLVAGAMTAARIWGVPEAVIGLTLLAVGTSLPELAAALNASAKGESDLVVGNVMGSNLFNILCVLGVAALIQPLPAEGLSWVDTSMFLGCAAVILPLMKTGNRISRAEGVMLLALYSGYMVLLSLR